MYSEWGWLLILAVFVWLGSLSFFIWLQSRFLKKLFPRSGERDIRKRFEEVFKDVGGFRQDLNKLQDKLSESEKSALKHVQRVELLRYNPYQDSGGDQSFTAVLLDDKGDGIILTSLHARSGTRVFAKPVISGKSGQYQFSKEEERAVSDAMKKNYG